MEWQARTAWPPFEEIAAAVGWAVILAVGSILTFGIPLAQGVDIRGQPAIIAGDLLEFRGQPVRLDAIIAPVDGQFCSVRGKRYDCHRVSATALTDLTVGANVVCIPTGRAIDGTPVARCFAGDHDLSEGMTYAGWALAYPRADNRYLRFERQAECAKRGLWRGEFELPWEARDIGDQFGRDGRSDER